MVLFCGQGRLVAVRQYAIFAAAPPTLRRTIWKRISKTRRTKRVQPAGRLKNDLSDGIGDIKNAASGEIKNLISDVEDLMARIADLKDADVVRVRSKVQRAVDATKQSLYDSADSIRKQAQSVASTADDYVRDSPWQAIGIAALVGAVVGILATRRS